MLQSLHMQSIIVTIATCIYIYVDIIIDHCHYYSIVMISIFNVNIFPQPQIFRRPENAFFKTIASSTRKPDGSAQLAASRSALM